MLMNFSSLAAPEAVMMTTFGAANDTKIHQRDNISVSLLYNSLQTGKRGIGLLNIYALELKHSDWVNYWQFSKSV